MITLEPPFYSVRGTTVLRDHEDPDQFYALPPRARLSRGEEGPEFVLYKYRRDLTDNPELDPTRAVGAGMAFLTSDASIADNELEALRTEVSRLAGRQNARVSQPLFLSGKAQLLIGDNRDDGMITVARSEVPVSPAAPHRATFALDLTAEGAALIEQAVAGGAVPAGMTYEFGFDGLLPALHATVKMDYDRVYDRFAASIGFEYSAVRVELDAELAWLRENGYIDIQITEFSSEADHKWQRQLVDELVRMRVAQDFFQPGMPPSPTAGSQGGALANMLTSILGDGEPTASSAMFVGKLKYQRTDELKTFRMEWSGRSAVSLIHTCVGLLTNQWDEEEGETPKVLEIDTDDDFFDHLRVTLRPAIDFDSYPDLREVVVHLAHGEDRTSFAFNADAVEPAVFTDAMDGPRDDTYRWSVDLSFDDTNGQGPGSISVGPFESTSRQLVVQPQDHFRSRAVRLVAGPLVAGSVTGFRVSLAVPDTELSHEIVLDEATPETTWRVRQPAGEGRIPVQVRIDWLDGDGVPQEGKWEDLEGDHLVALGPFRDVLEVRVLPNLDWQAVLWGEVALRYMDEDHVFEKTLRFDPGSPPEAVAVQVPLLDPQKRAFEVSRLIQFADGTVEQSDDWEPLERPVVVLGPKPRRTKQIRIARLGAFGDALAVRIDLMVDDEPFAVLMTAADSPQATVDLPLDEDGQLAYSYTVTSIGIEGENELRAGESTSPLLVIKL
ncbi:MAG: hypothetical protein AAF799_08295 [Myxococcota bacterium]